MLKSYHKWNIFEKKFFRLNNLGIIIMMVGSVFVVSLPIDDSIKAYFIGVLITTYALGRTYLWNKLEQMEMEWKREKNINVLQT